MKKDEELSNVHKKNKDLENKMNLIATSYEEISKGLNDMYLEKGVVFNGLKSLENELQQREELLHQEKIDFERQIQDLMATRQTDIRVIDNLRHEINDRNLVIEDLEATQKNLSMKIQGIEVKMDLGELETINSRVVDTNDSDYGQYCSKRADDTFVLTNNADTSGSMQEIVSDYQGKFSHMDMKIQESYCLNKGLKNYINLLESKNEDLSSKL